LSKKPAASQRDEMPKMLLALCALLVLSLAASQIHYNGPATSDAYERARIAEALQNGVPFESTAVGASGYNYPLLFDVLLAAASSLFGMPALQTLDVLSLIFGVAFALLVFVFAKRLSGNEAGAFAAAAIFLSPWIFYRLVTPISETFGLLLLLLAAFLFVRQKNALCFLSLAALALSHYRSLAVALAVLFFLAAFSRRFFDFAKIAALPAAYFLFVVPKSFNITNPFVYERGIFYYLTPALAALALLGAALLAKRAFAGKPENPEAAKIVAAFLLGALVFVPLVPFAFRQFVYLFFPAALLSGIALGPLKTRLENFFGKDYGARAFLAAFIGLLLASTVAVIKSPDGPHPLSASEIRAFSSLKNAPGTVVLAPFTYNYAIPYFSGKKVVVGAFAEGLPDGQKRINDLWVFFEGAGMDEKKRIVRDYNVDLICVDSARGAAGLWDLVARQAASNEAVLCFEASRD
jgi:hypothetical protein